MYVTKGNAYDKYIETKQTLEDNKKEFDNKEGTEILSELLENAEDAALTKKAWEYVNSLL